VIVGSVVCRQRNDWVRQWILPPWLVPRRPRR
jgi:hypothetical protein